MAEEDPTIAARRAEIDAEMRANLQQLAQAEAAFRAAAEAARAKEQGR